MIYWIVSYPKSGNTWLRLFLSSYLNGRLDINCPANFNLDDVAPAHYQPHLRKPANELTQTEYALVRPAVLLELLHLNYGRRLFLKTHNAFVSYAGVPMIPPVLTEGALYLVRDPRDIVVSYAYHCDQSFDKTIDFLCEEEAIAGTGRGTWHALLPWSTHVSSWLDKPEFSRHVVRYEDMVAGKAWHGILEHIGWEVDSEKIEAALQATEFASLQSQEKESGFRERSESSKVYFFREGKVGGWRDVLNEKQVARIEENHGETMQRLGYRTEE